MPTVREIVTMFSFKVDQNPLNSMRGALAGVGSSLRKTFDPERIKQTEHGFTKVNASMIGIKTVFSDLGNMSNKFFNGLTAVGALVGVAGASAAMTGLAASMKAVADHGDNVSDTANQIGVSTDELQALGYVAQLSGSNFEEMATSLRFLSNNAVDAAQNVEGPAALAFKRLNVSVLDTNGKVRSATSIMEDMADAFALLPEGPERTAIAMDLMGRAGTKMVPVLSQGREAVQALKDEAYGLGVVMSKDSLAAAGAFNDELDRLRAVTGGLRNLIGSALLPTMTKWVVDFRNLIAANKDLIAVRVENFIVGVTTAARTCWSVISSGWSIINGIAQALGGWEFLLKAVGGALLLLGGGAVLYAIGALASAVWVAVTAVAALEAGAIAAGIGMMIAWIKALAIPILIGAAIALVVLAIQDMWTYLQGGESIFGEWVKWTNEIGNKIYDAIVKPFVDAWENNAKSFWKAMGPIIKAWESLKSSVGSGLSFLGIGEPDEPTTQGGLLVQGGLGSGLMTPNQSIAPSPAFATQANQSSSVSMQNNFTINADGLNEEQARKVVSEEFARSNANMYRRAGENTLRRSME